MSQSKRTRDEQHMDTAMEHAVGRAIREALGFDVIEAVYKDTWRKARGYDRDTARKQANRIMRA